MNQRIPALIVLAIIMAMALAGCTSDGGLDLRILGQSWSDEWEKRWRCDGLTLYKKEHKGKIVFSGIDDEISALYYVDGLNQRWSWEKYGTSYAVVLGQGASGLIARYYDFSFADEDGMAKSRAIFFDCR